MARGGSGGAHRHPTNTPSLDIRTIRKKNKDGCTGWLVCVVVVVVVELERGSWRQGPRARVLEELAPARWR